MVKAQFKIQQMAFMLLAVVLFFIMVGMFFVVLQYRSLHKEAGQLEADKAILMSEFISQASEFSCTTDLGSRCIDTDKIMVLKDDKNYKGFWPVAYIKVRKFWPVADRDVICTNDNYPDCNVFNIYENNAGNQSASIGSIVSLCRHEQNQAICELGRIVIGYQLK